MAKWRFEPGHTAAEFCVRHMMVTYVRGHFKNIHGTLEFDPEKPEAGSVKVTIQAAELWTGEPERDQHLRSADFFDDTRAGFYAEARINRHDFQVNWNADMKDGGVVVGAEVLITIDAEAILGQ